MYFSQSAGICSSHALILSFLGYRFTVGQGTGEKRHFTQYEREGKQVRNGLNIADQTRMSFYYLRKGRCSYSGGLWVQLYTFLIGFHYYNCKHFFACLG